VVPGALVEDNGTQAIGVNDFNTVANNGTISAMTTGAIGIAAGDDNVITNSAAITTGFDGMGISAGNNNLITNSGTITVGDISIVGSYGMVVGDNNTITNSGTITAGLDSNGIFAGSNNFITNSGKIATGDEGTGILAAESNMIVNSGKLTVGVGGTGIEVFDDNIVTNSGTITGGDTSVGIAALGSNNIVTNNGTITVGNNAGSAAVGIVVGFGSTATNNGAIVAGIGSIAIEGSFFSTIINNGTITVGSAGLDYSAGIDVTGVSNNTVVNNGTITVGAGGVGINTGDSNFITNNGTVVAGANGLSIGTCGCVPATSNVVVNNGTLDGQIFLAAFGGPGNTFNNFGLITITDPGTPVGAGHLIDGTFSQFGSGTLALRVNNAVVSDTLSTGTANLGGTLGAVVQPGLYGASTTYTAVVSASNPIATQFAQVQAFAAGTTTPLAFFTASATYNSNTVDLTLTRLAFNAVPGETPNESAVANAVNPLYSTSLTGGAAAFFSALLQSSSVKVLDQLSGEGTTGTQNAAFFAESLFMASLLDQANAWRDGNQPGSVPTDAAPLGYAAEPSESEPLALVPKAPSAYLPSWHGWATGFGGVLSLKGDPSVGSADFSDRIGGGGLGFDYRAKSDLLLGLGFGVSRSTFDVNDRSTSGTVDGGHIGAYGMQLWGQAYLSGLVSYSRNDNSTTRTIAGIGPTETATGSFASDQLGGRLEAGRTWTFDRYNVTPFAAVQFSELWQRGYTESSSTSTGGPGMLGLSYQPLAVWSLPTFLGTQLDTRVAVDDGIVWQPYARASWVHEFNPTRQINAFFNVLPGAGFTVDGARAASDSAKLDLGSRLALNRYASVVLNFNGEFSEQGSSYAGTGAFRVNW
jgi:outer membrane autotransporter protein